MFYFIGAMVALSAIMLKSIINPIIYAVRIPEIKDQFNKLFSCCPCVHKAVPMPLVTLIYATNATIENDSEHTFTAHEKKNK